MTGIINQLLIEYFPMHHIISRLPISSKWHIALRTIPLVAIVLLIKYIVHNMGYEILELNSLFTAIISANIFLIGFLISGTLVDYKESEKLPGELSSSLETMADEAIIIYKQKKSKDAVVFLQKLILFNDLLLDWFHKKIHSDELIRQLQTFNDDFIALEPQTQANFIVRLKQEQNALRRVVRRIHTIRETSFIGAGYAIAEIITAILLLGLIIIQMQPFSESLFFVSFVAFILIYMIYFIKDLDNPFGYYDKTNLAADVSLFPLEDSKRRLSSYLDEMQSVPKKASAKRK